MKDQPIRIVKSSGEKVIFSFEKLRRSLMRTGAEPAMVDAILKIVKDELYQGITTNELYNRAFDSATKTLTINGIKCKVKDAWDWEATPRKVTITYSGLTTDGLPFWGKKI